MAQIGTKGIEAAECSTTMANGKRISKYKYLYRGTALKWGGASPLQDNYYICIHMSDKAPQGSMGAMR
jgi:hypothetical protein